MIMNLNKTIKNLKGLLNLTLEELAMNLDLTYETIHKLEISPDDVDKKTIESFYSFADKNKINLNRIYESLIKEEFNKENQIVLFHGSKTFINFPINIALSKVNNDLGKGFYLGESFDQAGMYISNSNSSNVYAFSLSLKNLKIYKFHVNKEWMIAIAYFRGWLNEYKNSAIILNILNDLKDVDVIIAPIADNRMFDIIKEFINGEITDLQCQHALAATDLGMQYVLKTDKAINNLELIELLFLSRVEKEKYVDYKIEMSKNSLNKVKVARIEYRGKGQYIDEVLK